MPTMQFLQKILPQGGVKQWWAKKGSEIRSGSCSTVQQLADVVIELDKRGADVYFACSGFKDGLTRKQDNVSAVRSYWLDIDVGDGKGYATKEDAYQELANFCQRAALPFPTVVCSGGGLHVYWSLKNDISPSVWKAKALQLKALTEVLGLKADPSRTADEASILRVPGTNNLKTGTPRPVYAMYEAEPLDDLILVPAASNSNSGLTGGIKDKAVAPDMTVGFGDGYRTDALTHRIGWLIGPQQMEYEDALTALRQWNGFNSPPLDDDKIVHTLASLWGKEQNQRQKKIEAVFEAPTMPDLPFGFRWGQNQSLLQMVEGKEGEEIPKVISEFPIYVDRILRHETTGEHFLVLKHRRPLTGWEEITISAGDMRGTTWASTLAKQGANINPWMERAFQIYVTGARNMISSNSHDSQQYDQCGPRDDFTSFVLGDLLYKSDGTVTKCGVTPDVAVRAKYLGPQRGASLPAWTDAADCLFAQGCESQGFTLLASMAAPLIHMLCGDEGGAILSIISPDSSQGKTTALEAAASFWGVVKGLKVSTVDTRNATMKATSTLGYLPILWDEKDNKPRDSKYIIEQKQIFTNGYDRARLNRDATAQDVSKPWHTIQIEASNRPFVEVAIDAKEEAMLARVLELTVTIPDYIRKSAVKNDLRTALLSNGGVAGDAYLKYIMRPDIMPRIRQQMFAVRDHLQQKLGLGGDYRYIIWMLAGCTVAGAVAKKMGILHFDLDRIINYACDQVLARAHEKKNHSVNPLHQILDFIERHIADAIIVDRAWTAGQEMTVLKPPGSQGMSMRIEKQTRMCYMSYSAFRRYCKEADIQSYRWLFQKAILTGAVEEKKVQRSLAAGTMYATASNTICLAIHLGHEAFGDTDFEAVIDQKVEEEKKSGHKSYPARK